MRKGVTILGYYGAGNTGDEAILQSMIGSLRNQGINDITVLSHNPEQTKKAHNVRSIYTGRRFNGLKPIYNQLKQSQLFILGGGGLLQDHYRRVVPYWLSRVIIAFLAGTPVMYYAHGVGPLRTKSAKRLVKIISNRVNRITLRDDPSLKLLHQLGVNRPEMEVTADPAIALNAAINGKEILEAEGINLSDGKIKIAVCLRSWDEESHIPILIESLKLLREKYNIQYVFLPFQFGQDESISQFVLENIEDGNSVMIKGSYTPDQMVAILKEMDGIIGMRLHALILGSISFRPLFGLIYDPKVENFMERIGLKKYCYNIGQLKDQKEQLMQSIEDWMNNRDIIIEQIKNPVQEMRKLAIRNAEIAKKIIG